MSEVGYRAALKAVIGVMAALVLAFVLRGTLWPDKLGPRLPAALDQHVWLVSQDALHQFDAQGRRLQSLPLHELGMGEAVSSLQFTAPDVAFVHDAQGVRRCLISQKTCTTLALPGLQATPGFRWVRVAGDEGEIVVSDTAAHRILVFRRTGAGAPYTLARTYDQGLRFPNQTLPDEGRLWVANTNRHEVAALDATGASPAPVVHRPVDFPGLRPGRRFPFAMQRDGGQGQWVLVAGPAMRDADLLRMDGEFKPRQVVALSPDQDPNGLLWTGGRLLVTDATQFQVHQVTADGQVLQPFGDAVFQAELQAGRSAYVWGQRLPTLLMGAIAALMALAVVLGWKAGEFRRLTGPRWRASGDAAAHLEDDLAGEAAGRAGGPQAEAQPTAPVAKTRLRAQVAPRAAGLRAPQPGSVTKVRALPGATATRRRWLVGLGVLFVGLLVALMVGFWPGYFQRDCGPDLPCNLPRIVRWMAGIATVFVVIVYATAWNMLRRCESLRIATDGRRVAVQWAGGKVAKAPAEQVTCTRQHLLIGAHTVPLRINGSPLFDEAAFRRDILGRLPQLNVLDGPFDLGWLRHMLRHGGWKGRVTAVVVIALVLLALGRLVAVAWRHLG